MPIIERHALSGRPTSTPRIRSSMSRWPFRCSSTSSRSAGITRSSTSTFRKCRNGST
jgi:hypothetical protein